MRHPPQVLGGMYCVHSLLLYLRVLPLRSTARPSGAEAWSLLLLNSATVTLACSTYHSYCGNGGRAGSKEGTADDGGSTRGGYFQNAVCMKWLHPIRTVDYPLFAAWMTYGE